MRCDAVTQENTGINPRAVWFMIGGIIDMRRLYKDLNARVNNPLDDGWVVGHVSLVDKVKLGKDAED